MQCELIKKYLFLKWIEYDVNLNLSKNIFTFNKTYSVWDKNNAYG